jgi:hypothetical protein
MKFYVYHPLTIGLVYQLTHNTQNRVIDEKNSKVACTYNNVDMEFNFNNFTETEKGAFHIIVRQEMVTKEFGMIPEAREFLPDVGFPECIKHEYKALIDGLKWDLNWILLWNYGENSFVHLRRENISKTREIKYLNELSKKSIFVSDNLFNNETDIGVDSKNFVNTLTNDVYVWNYLAHIRWASEFKNIYKNLNFDYKLGVSFRSPKPHRIQILELLARENNEDIFLSFSSAIFEEYRGTYDHSWSDIHYDKLLEHIKTIPNVHLNDVGFDVKNDFENLYIVGNTEKNQMEYDYYFRILPKSKVQLLDETHAYKNNIDIPMNLSEKTYILLLANIPFISTHHYPFDIIKNYIIDLDYPYYDEMVEVTTHPHKLVDFIKKFLQNFDEMYPKIKDYTNKVHTELMNRLQNENSFLEHMTTKI